MKMQGEGPLGISDPTQTWQVDRAKAGNEGTRGQVAAPTGDRVEVSASARLMNSAVQAAEKAPDIRQDVVERARMKLAAGEIGADPERLADRIIDSLLK